MPRLQPKPFWWCLTPGGESLQGKQLMWMGCVIPELLQSSGDGAEPWAHRTRDSFFQETSQHTTNRAVSTCSVIWGRAAQSFPAPLWHPEITKSQELRIRDEVMDILQNLFFFFNFFYFTRASSLSPAGFLNAQHLLVSKPGAWPVSSRILPAVPLGIRTQLHLHSQQDHPPPTSPFLHRGNHVRFLGGEGRDC